MNSLCIRCGYSNDDRTDGIAKCPECGEHSFVDVITIADLINEIYLHYSDNEPFDEWIKTIRGDE